jgi:hypothetical protein
MLWLGAAGACIALLAGSVSGTAISAPATSGVPLVGTGSPQTGDFTPSGENDATKVEFAGSEDDSADPYDGNIIDRSLSNGAGKGGSTSSGKKAKSNPSFVFGFSGLNHYQQRYARGGNQFSLEPPDQGLCVGNGDVVEVVNDVFNVYGTTTGQSVLPDNTATNIVASFPRNVNHAIDLNSFFGYPAAINRTTGRFGQEVTDPSCIYDSATNRWFVVVLTLETNPTTGAFTHQNHLDLAVSRTGDPTGTWNIYRIDATNDGSNIGGVNPGPYLGDYPHIGADTNGIYLTTNAYPWCCNGFAGAQIYALSKAQLAAGSATVAFQHIDTTGMVAAPSTAGSTQAGFTVWPAQAPNGIFNTNDNGTEYFMSSNAADEAQSPLTGAGGSHTSNQLIVWTLRNTASINSSSPALSLTNQILSVGQYGVPPAARQPGSGSAPTTDTPQGFCINNVSTPTIAGLGCWKLLFGSEPAHDEVVSRPDSNDSRMQQVTWANGKLWGALDTSLNSGTGPARAGIEWFIVNPNAGKVVNSGYLGASGYDFTYPAIGVTPSGRGVMAFTAMGDTLYPSAAYAPIDAIAGAGAWSVVDGGTGAADADGFTSYKAQVGNPPRTRWGDYGAASVDGNDVWIASEYIGAACSYSAWGGPFFGLPGDNLLGTCGGASHGPGVRTALGNWSTRISEFTP